MPKRTDIKSILILGSGPIQIGQAAEFDYSGTQALKALKKEGYRVILVNSNPATIMTDPDISDATYIEPLTIEYLEKIIIKEKPDAILPTLGGQTALNLAMELHKTGILEKYKVELIGAKAEAIHKGEDREAFQAAMKKIGVETAKGKMISSMEEAIEYQKELGLPVVIRPSFTLGGTGGGIAHTYEEFLSITEGGLRDSPVHSVLLEESILGWKEYELEVMRDTKDTVVIITSIENFDPMGVHTGDSITIAPAQTLSDVEYQNLRDKSLKIIREIGVDTGGSNIQYAINPKDGRVIVIEMNPRVSRSSALASKATGFPIAKIAALLAVGYHLDELKNDITKETPAAFEPTIDYVVTKVPRFAFEKFPEAKDTLGTQMRSVGEVMAIGRTFKESLQKALRSTESDLKSSFSKMSDNDLKNLLYPNPKRIYAIMELIGRDYNLEELHKITKIDPWFLNQIKEIKQAEKEIKQLNPNNLSKKEWREIKRLGFSDDNLAKIWNTNSNLIRKMRKDLGVIPVYKTVDTCAAEFEAFTPYHYSTYELEDEVKPTDKSKITILGSGPNRIGQGVEFDYATVHAVWALQEKGFETIMINSNPETVSTDYDTADRLYFEPLSLEDTLNVIEHENVFGTIVQLGGQTPLKLAQKLKDNGVNIIGTSPETIHKAEDRASFNALCEELDILQPIGEVVESQNAIFIAKKIGFPLMVRPSYVLGGRAMRIVNNEEELSNYLNEVYAFIQDKPTILLDKFLSDAIELDVDCLCDGENAVVAGIMEHIEEAGIHSGDSACILPPVNISNEMLEKVQETTKKLALNLQVKGLINIQYAIKDDQLYVIEANPRASRTVPFVSKAVGIPLAKYAALIAAGSSLKEIGFTETPKINTFSVKEVHLPFLKFEKIIPILGPEMKSTGESMGIDEDPYNAYYKAQIGAKNYIEKGKILVVADHETEEIFKKIGCEVVTESHYNGSPEDYVMVIDFSGKYLREFLERGKAIVSTKRSAIWTAKALEAKKIKVKSLQEWLK